MNLIIRRPHAPLFLVTTALISVLSACAAPPSPSSATPISSLVPTVIAQQTQIAGLQATVVAQHQEMTALQTSVAKQKERPTAIPLPALVSPTDAPLAVGTQFFQALIAGDINKAFAMLPADDQSPVVHQTVEKLVNGLRGCNTSKVQYLERSVPSAATVHIVTAVYQPPCGNLTGLPGTIGEISSSTEKAGSVGSCTVVVDQVNDAWRVEIGTGSQVSTSSFTVATLMEGCIS